VRLQESGHVLVRDIEHERVANHVLSWLRDGATSAGEQSV
jgi:esterase/lipase